MVVEGNSIYGNLIYALGNFEGDIIAVKSVKWYGCPMIYERIWYNLYVLDTFLFTLGRARLNGFRISISYVIYWYWYAYCKQICLFNPANFFNSTGHPFLSSLSLV